MRAKEKHITVLALFVNYILQGMAAIILSQHLDKLTIQLNTTAKNISLVISAIGLGRVLVLYLSGYLSDKYGRKMIILLGMISYILFFLGILLSTHILSAAFFALFAGFANAFLDTGTYPAIAEIYPEHAGSISVFNKAFISIGQFILPFLVSYFISNDIYYGYSFILCIVIAVVNLIVVWFCKFPKDRQCNNTQSISAPTFTKSQPSLKKEGIALFILGFTIVTLFNIIVWWLPEYAIQLAGMEREAALTLVSSYSLGSFISVFITAYISKKTKANDKILLICSTITLFILILIVCIPTPLICKVGAFGIGIFAAGGIWQLALAIMLAFFPSRKGKATSIYTMATSISVMICPYLTGLIADINIRYVMIFNVSVAIINLVCVAYVYKRYNEVF